MNGPNESNWDLEKSKNKMNHSVMSHNSNNKTAINDKSQAPTLLDMMGDDMSQGSRYTQESHYKLGLEEEIKRDRMKADETIAYEKLKEERVLKKDGTPHKYFMSSIESICEKQDIHLLDYMYFLKKFAFIMILLF